jgi:hypothetical protein
MLELTVDVLVAVLESELDGMLDFSRLRLPGPYSKENVYDQHLVIRSARK